MARGREIVAKKIKDTDYLYISTRLKVLEKNMLSREKLSRMASAKTDDEALKILGENGWQDVEPDRLDSLERAISARRQEMLDLLYRYAPDTGIIDIFRLKYDYHNIKSIIKAEAQGINCAHLLTDAGTVPSAKMVAALRDKAQDDLPQVMYDAAIEAHDTLARTRDPQLSDILLDKAMLVHMMQLAVKVNSAFLQGYVSLMADCANLRITTRALLTGKGYDYLKRSLVAGGKVSPEELSVNPSAESLAGLFYHTPLRDASRCAVESIKENGPLAALDKACDNALLEYLKSSRFIPFGEAQVITYLLLVENELTSVRIILAGRAAGHSEQTIMERLRFGYYV